MIDVALNVVFCKASVLGFCKELQNSQVTIKAHGPLINQLALNIFVRKVGPIKLYKNSASLSKVVPPELYEYESFHVKSVWISQSLFQCLNFRNVLTFKDC